MEQDGKKLRFWSRTWVHIIFLIFLYPVGVILLFAKSTLGIGAKIAMTIVFGLFFLFCLGQSDNDLPSGDVIDRERSGQMAADMNAAPVEIVRKPKPKETIFNIGDEFQLGNFAYRIDDASVVNKVGNQYFKHVAQEGAVLIVVKYVIGNMSKETQTVMTDDFELLDHAGRKFRPSSNANTAYMMSGNNQKDFIVSEVQPGLSKRMVSVYEVPKDSVDNEGLFVIVPEKGIWGTGKAKVRLK